MLENYSPPPGCLFEQSLQNKFSFLEMSFLVDCGVQPFLADNIYIQITYGKQGTAKRKVSMQVKGRYSKLECNITINYSRKRYFGQLIVDLLQSKTSYPAPFLGATNPKYLTHRSSAAWGWFHGPQKGPLLGSWQHRQVHPQQRRPAREQQPKQGQNLVPLAVHI